MFLWILFTRTQWKFADLDKTMQKNEKNDEMITEDIKTAEKNSKKEEKKSLSQNSSNVNIHVK